MPREGFDGRREGNGKRGRYAGVADAKAWQEIKRGVCSHCRHAGTKR